MSAGETFFSLADRLVRGTGNRRPRDVVSGWVVSFLLDARVPPQAARSSCRAELNASRYG
jgi:hypothetical protein